jgi:hypothetical protein
VELRRFRPYTLTFVPPTDRTVRGSNSSGCEILPNLPDRPSVPSSLLCYGYRVVPGENRPGRGVDHPHTSSSEIKETVELHLYSPSGSS